MRGYVIEEAKKLAKEYNNIYVGTEYFTAICLREDKELQYILGISYDDYMNEYLNFIGANSKEEVKEINSKGDTGLFITPLLNKCLKEIQDFTPRKFIIKLLKTKTGYGYAILMGVSSDRYLKLLRNNNKKRKVVSNE